MEAMFESHIMYNPDFLQEVRRRKAEERERREKFAEVQRHRAHARLASEEQDWPAEMNRRERFKRLAKNSREYEARAKIKARAGQLKAPPKPLRDHRKLVACLPGYRGTCLVGQTREQRITDAISGFTGVEPSDIKGKGRQHKFLGPRRDLIKALRDNLGWSLPQIGRFINRDHTTVLHALRQKEALEELRLKQEQERTADEMTL